MSDQHCIIVGGSHAAAQLAQSLRQSGWPGKITLVSSEPIPPYHRPPLSKAYLDGSSSAEKLFIRPPAFYDKLDAELILNTRVTEIDRENQCIKLDNGTTLSYDKLALTTGAVVRKIPLPGSELKGVYYLRDIADVDGIKEHVGEGKSAVIIGGGYIGLEAAASLRKLGMQVTVLEAMSRVLQRVTTEEVSAFYTRVHQEEGVHVVTDASVEKINGDTQVTGVSLADQTLFAADLVIIGVGVMPETQLAEAAGLVIDNGIVVDEFARTSDLNIVAAGDCTNHHNPIYDSQLRLESVQNATDQAKVAAATLCGKLEAYRALPWFWSDQYDLKLQIAGLSQGYDKVVIRGDTKTGRSFAAFYYAQDKLIAVDAINRPKEFVYCKKLLAEGKSISPDQVVDESIDLKDMAPI